MRESAIHTARTKMNTQKLGPNVFQIGFLVGHIATSLEKWILNNTNTTFLSGLLEVIRETEQRVEDTEYSGLTERSRSLPKLTEPICPSTNKLGFNEVVRLELLN